MRADNSKVGHAHPALGAVLDQAHAPDPLLISRKAGSYGFEKAAIARLKGVNIGDTAIMDKGEDPIAAKKKREEDRKKYADLQEELKKARREADERTLR